MKRSRQRGFTLIEILAAMTLFSILGMGMAQFAVTSLRRTSDNRATTGGVLVGQQEIEDLRGLDYVDIVSRTFTSTVAGETYSVSTNVANDTPADGMKQITVTVTWTAPIGSRTYVVRTILTSIT